jgi:hypothetical protein
LVLDLLVLLRAIPTGSKAMLPERILGISPQDQAESNRLRSLVEPSEERIEAFSRATAFKRTSAFCKTRPGLQIDELTACPAACRKLSEHESFAPELAAIPRLCYVVAGKWNRVRNAMFLIMQPQSL